MILKVNDWLKIKNCFSLNDSYKSRKQRSNADKQQKNQRNQPEDPCLFSAILLIFLAHTDALFMFSKRFEDARIVFD